MKNIIKYIVVISSILLVLLIVGCSQNNSYDTEKTNQFETGNVDNQNNIITPNNQETKTNSNYCFNVDNEVWQERCQAYKDANSDLCDSFDNGNPSGQNDIDECYYILSVNTGDNNCAKIENKKLRWECEAIATKDMNQCAYSIDLESEIWCLRNYMQFYQDKEACDLIGQKEQEIKNAGLVDGEGNIKFGLSEDDCLNSLKTIEQGSKRTEEETIIAVYGNSCKSEYNNQDCSTYEDEWEESDCLLCQAMNNKEPNKCLLIKNNRRDNCITALSLLTKDSTFCNEKSKDVDSCINQYGRSISVDVCLNPANADCIISAVESMDETNQQIDSNVCSSIKDVNKKGNCYVEYAKSSIEMS